jgi:type IV secretion system protein TrbI
MTDNDFTSHTEARTGPHAEPQAEPRLRRNLALPKGVFEKNLKTFLYLGAALLVVLAALFSSFDNTKKTPAGQGAAKGQPPQPALQDNTDSNVQELKNQLQAERQKEQQATLAAAAMADPALVSATPPQQAAAASGPTGVAVPCAPGRPCPPLQLANMQTQPTPLQQQAELIAAKERERANDARFASNLVYSRSAEQPQQPPQQDQIVSAQYDHTKQQTNRSPVAPEVEAKQEETSAGYKRPPEANVDSATGQPYLIYEGSVLDTVLMNRLDGDAVGPVKVLVSNPLYSHDHQHVIIPDGTVVLGEAKKIGATGFGQQRRMAVVFHRLIMPDGYSVDLDQFHGLDQIGEAGLKDKVNNHYLQIFGTSIALGVIAGAGEVTQGGGTITTSGSQAFTNGTAASVSQSATTILDRFMQIPPTLTIREGHRVKVYFTQDLLLPAYSNHTIPPTF